MKQENDADNPDFDDSIGFDSRNSKRAPPTLQASVTNSLNVDL